MGNQKFTKNIIPIEIELGFVRVPNQFRKLFPEEISKVRFYLGDSKKLTELSYNPKHQRIFGLVQFFRTNKVKAKDVLEFEKLDEQTFQLKVKKLSANEKKQIEFTQEEAEEIINISELNSKTKGDIVEQRVAELILLYGQGLLNVYKPVSDIEGVDLIVIKKGYY